MYMAAGLRSMNAELVISSYSDTKLRSRRMAALTPISNTTGYFSELLGDVVLEGGD